MGGLLVAQVCEAACGRSATRVDRLADAWPSTDCSSMASLFERGAFVESRQLPCNLVTSTRSSRGDKSCVRCRSLLHCPSRVAIPRHPTFASFATVGGARVSPGRAVSPTAGVARRPVGRASATAVFPTALWSLPMRGGVVSVRALRCHSVPRPKVWLRRPVMPSDSNVQGNSLNDQSRVGM